MGLRPVCFRLITPRMVRLEEPRREALCSVQGGGGGACALLWYTRLTTAYGSPPHTVSGSPPLAPLRVIGDLPCARGPAQPQPAQRTGTRLGSWLMPFYFHNQCVGKRD